MKNKNRILTESQKRQIIKNKEKTILESFASTFNKIKRIDENEIGQPSNNLDLEISSIYISTRGEFELELWDNNSDNFSGTLYGDLDRFDIEDDHEVVRPIFYGLNYTYFSGEINGEQINIKGNEEVITVLRSVKNNLPEIILKDVDDYMDNGFDYEDFTQTYREEGSDNYAAGAEDHSDYLRDR